MLMKPPIFVRTLSKEEREALEAGLRSSDAFVLRRCQILLASSKGERPPRIAERSEEHTSELQSHSDLHSFPTRRSSDLRGSGSGPALLRCFRLTPLPNPSSQLKGRAPAPDSRKSRLRTADRAQCHPRVQRARP